MLYYNLGDDIIAFTTDRTIGREPEAIWAALEQDGVVLPGTPHRYARPHQTHGDRTIILLPQCPAKSDWNSLRAVLDELAQQKSTEYRVPPDRISEIDDAALTDAACARLFGRETP